MKKLGLLRHAKSDWDDMATRDFDRGLNDRGRRGAALMGEFFTRTGLAWETVLASPAERVRRTLDLTLPDAAPVWDDRLYLASAETIFDVIRELAGEAETVLVSGHNPGMQEALLALVPPAAEDSLFDEAARKFPTTGFALLELAINDWSQLAEGCGRLTHFKRPRDLDPALGPEH